MRRYYDAYAGKLNRGGAAVANFKFNLDPKKILEAALKAADGHIKKKVFGQRCPVHGQAARVVRKGDGWDVLACCVEFRTTILARLKK